MCGSTGRADAKPSTIPTEGDVPNDCRGHPPCQPIQMYGRSHGSGPTPTHTLTPAAVWPAASALPGGDVEDVQVVAMQGCGDQEGAGGVKLEGKQGAGVGSEVCNNLAVGDIPHHDCANKLSVCCCALPVCSAYGCQAVRVSDIRLI